MAKRTSSKGTIPAAPVATAGAGFGANATAVNLAAWADRVGAPAHTPEAQQRSNALAKPRQTFASAQPRGPLAIGGPGRDLVDRALGMRDARLDDEGQPHTGPLALGSPGRERIGRALDMRDARLDDEGTPHVGPLALGSPGRDRIRQALDMRNAREDDEPPPSPRDISDAQAFTAWDNVTNRMENNQLHPKVEKQLEPMQSAMRTSIAKRGGADKRAEQANQIDAFNQANRHFEDSHMQSHASPQPDQQASGPTGKPRGFQIHKVQAAAQHAKGNNYQGPDDDGSD